MARKPAKKNRRSNRHKRSLHRRHKKHVRRTKKHRTKHIKHRAKHTRQRKKHRRRRRRRTRRVMKGGCGQCVSGNNMFRSQPSPFQGPVSMTGEAAKGSNYYAKLQNPNLPDPQSTNGGTTIVQKGGGLLGPNTLYNLGLGGLQRGWWDASNAAKNVYHQWNGENPIPSASSMSQPIDSKVKIISYDPPNVSSIYDSGAKQSAQFTLGNQ